MNRGIAWKFVDLYRPVLQRPGTWDRINAVVTDASADPVAVAEPREVTKVVVPEVSP
jgi:hypothetical protein